MVQIGGPSDRFMAMQSNAIQATLLAPPLTTMAVQKSGMKELFDVSKLDVLYPLESITTPPQFSAKQPAAAEKIFMGLATALHNYQDDPQSGIAFQAKQFKFTPDQAEIAYRACARAMHPDLRLPAAAVMDSAMKEIAARVEKARNMAVEKGPPAALRSIASHEFVFV